MKYVRPEVAVLEGMSEGVYMASGDVRQCESQYMNGNYKAPEGGKVNGGTYTYGSLGCRSCPADINYHCAVAAQEYESIRPGKPCMPQWEANGHSENETYVQGADFNEFEPG